MVLVESEESEDKSRCEEIPEQLAVTGTEQRKAEQGIHKNSGGEYRC